MVLQAAGIVISVSLPHSQNTPRLIVFRVDGRITEVLIHILDEDDIAERESARLSEEVNV